MQPGGPLEAEHIAAAIAPIIDRLRIAVVTALRPALGEYADRTGIPTPVLQPLGMLRNTMPDRAVAIDDVLEVFLYQPADQVRGALDTLVAAHMLEAVGDDSIRLAGGGRTLINDVYDKTQTFVDQSWSAHSALVATLLPLATRACAAVSATGGRATHVMAPRYEPAGASAALLLAESLTPLRFHRFDAHAASWRAEGLTVEQVQELGDGEQRQRIEDETNRRAAAPYAVLTADERFTLLAGLGALPN